MHDVAGQHTGYIFVDHCSIYAKRALNAINGKTISRVETHNLSNLNDKYLLILYLHVDQFTNIMNGFSMVYVDCYRFSIGEQAVFHLDLYYSHPFYLIYITPLLLLGSWSS